MHREAMEVELAPAVGLWLAQSGKQTEGRMDAMAGSPGKAWGILEGPRFS